MKRSLLAIALILISRLVMAQDIPSMTPPVFKDRIVKLQFFSPLTGNLTFGYEQALIKSITLTGEAGIIGASLVHLDAHQKGFLMKAGAKFYFSPDYYLDGMKRYNDFQGAYFNPVLVYSGFGFDYYDNNGKKQRGTNNSFGLLLHLGKQWVISNVIALELYGGIGYGYSWVSANEYSYSAGNVTDLSEIQPYKFSHIQPSNDVPIAFDAGFNIGILLK